MKIQQTARVTLVSLSYSHFHFLAPVGMPRDLEATPISASILLITWLPPVYTEINGILTDFVLIYSSTKDNGPKDVEKVIPAIEGANNYYFILKGLSYGGPDFNISLAASNTDGRGPATNITAPTLHSGLLHKNIKKFQQFVISNLL